MKKGNLISHIIRQKSNIFITAAKYSLVQNAAETALQSNSVCSNLAAMYRGARASLPSPSTVRVTWLVDATITPSAQLTIVFNFWKTNLYVYFQAVFQKIQVCLLRFDLKISRIFVLLWKLQRVYNNTRRLWSYSLFTASSWAFFCGWVRV